MPLQSAFSVPGTGSIPHCRCPLTLMGLGPPSGSLSPPSLLAQQLWAPVHHLPRGCWLAGASSALVCVGFKNKRPRFSLWVGQQSWLRQTDRPMKVTAVVCGLSAQTDTPKLDRGPNTFLEDWLVLTKKLVPASLPQGQHEK